MANDGLPSGWESVYSNEWKKVVFYNESTGEKCVDRPSGHPRTWSVRELERTGAKWLKGLELQLHPDKTNGNKKKEEVLRDLFKLKKGLKNLGLLN